MYPIFPDAQSMPTLPQKWVPLETKATLLPAGRRRRRRYFAVAAGRGQVG
jgi:hypothetical protein